MSTQHSTALRPSWVAATTYGLAIMGLTVPRLHSGSALWLDEALSVNIARLPAPDLFAALRHDGSPHSPSSSCAAVRPAGRRR